MDAEQWRRDPAYLIEALRAANGSWTPPQDLTRGTFRCPLHEDHNPSAAIYLDHDHVWRFKCHGCGVGGDAPAIVQHIRQCTFPEAVQWLEERFGNKPRPRNQARTEPIPQLGPDHWARLYREYQTAYTEEQITSLARKLGVTVRSLEIVGIGWSSAYGWAFPERDAAGEIVGISHRAADGSKRAAKGGHRGLTIPEGFASMPDPVLVVEGPSDVAACLSVGLTAVGRPSAQSHKHLPELLTGRVAIVLGENDRRTIQDGPNAGTQQWPGQEGMLAVTAALQASKKLKGVTCRHVPERDKDVRAWLNKHKADLANTGYLQLLGVNLLNLILGRAAEMLDADEIEEDPETGDRLTKAAVCVRLANELDLWVDEEEEAWVTLGRKGHVENWPLGSLRLREWLAGRYNEATGRTAEESALKQAATVLASRAREVGQRHRVWTRFGRGGDNVYLDLVDEHWRAIEISPKGWEIIANPPIKFRRGKGAKPICEPRGRHGIAPLREELRELVNVASDEDFILLVAFLVGCFAPRGPYPLLVVSGEQGSAKSTACRVIAGLVDPCKAQLRGQPPTPRDLMIHARNAWVLGFDNLGGLPGWFSDALCMMSTGGGLGVRELYADDRETIFDAMRPVILNGITNVTERPDLVDRRIAINLPTIPEAARRPESEIWPEFKRLQPAILGALLDAVSTGLRNLGTVKLPVLPRLADFALWVTACEPALPWAPGAFLEAYTLGRAASQIDTVDANPVATALRDWVASWPAGRAEWAGRPAELLAAIEEVATTNIKKLKQWPKDPAAMTRRLKTYAPPLRAVAGIELVFPGQNRREGGVRQYVVRRIA